MYFLIDQSFSAMKKLLLIALTLIVTRIVAQETISLTLEVAEVTATEKIYNLIVDDFDDMVGWQYTMLFDGTEMRFKEIRNSVLEDLDSHDFNEPYPGVLLTAWIVTDLDPEDFSEPTVAFQIVFELFEPGGSGVCFSESPLEYEFIMQEVPGQAFLNEVVVSDDCHIDFPIALNTTGLENSNGNMLPEISKVHLSQNGESGFTLSEDLEMQITLYDLSGKVIGSTPTQLFVKGIHFIKFDKPLIEGVYIFQAVTPTEQRATFKLHPR